MSGNFTHSAAKIVQQALVNRAIGTPPVSNGSWPIFVSNLPDTPDNLIVVSRGVDDFHGRVQVTGQVQLHFGIQVRIRATDEETANAKLKQILDAFDTHPTCIYREAVTIAGITYCIQTINRTPLLVGPMTEPGVSKRQVVFVNALADIIQITP